MTITIGWWLLPALVSATCVVAAFRPYRRHGAYDFGAILRGFWLIPALAVWVVYFVAREMVS